MDGVHSAGAPEPAALAAPAAPPERTYTSAERIFGSMRFGDQHGVVPMATELGVSLEARGIKLSIINMAGGGDIDTAVFETIEQCDTFLVFGSAKYGEDTGNQACTFYEYKHAFSRKKRIILIRMIPFDQEFDELQGRVIFGANKLVFPWMVGTPMPADLVDEIMKAIAPPTAAAIAPAAGATASPLAPVVAPAAWPADLAELVGVPAFAACLADLEVNSLASFGESIDLEEGHDKQLQAVLAAMPNKPKKAKGLKARCTRQLNELLTLLAIFDRFDQDDDTLLSQAEVAAIPAERVVAKSTGAALSGAFDASGAAKSGFWNFAEFFAAAALVEGEGVPPEPEPDFAAELAKAQAAAEQMRAAAAKEAEQMREVRNFD